MSEHRASRVIKFEDYYIYIIYIPNLEMRITLSKRKREQNRFKKNSEKVKRSSKKAKERSKKAAKKHETQRESIKRARKSTIKQCRNAADRNLK